MSEYQPNNSTTKDSADESARVTSFFSDEEKRKILDIIEKLDLVEFEIPRYLMQLLCYSGYDTIYALSEMNLDEDIKKLEQFARSELKSLLEAHEAREFYGIYFRNPSIFKIADGHVKLLSILTNECKAYLKKRSNDVKKKSKLQLTTQTNQKRKNTSPTVTKSKLNKPSSKPNSSTLSPTTSVSNSSFSSSTNVEANISQDINNELDANAKALAETHIKQVVSRYVTNFCTDLEDSIKVPLLEKLKDLEVHAEMKYATIRCIKCDFMSKSFCQQDENQKKRWVLSNFNKHFKTHFKPNKNAKNETKSKLKSTSILSFITTHATPQNPKKESQVSTPALTTEHLNSVSLSASGTELESSLVSEVGVENLVSTQLFHENNLTNENFDSRLDHVVIEDEDLDEDIIIEDMLDCGRFEGQLSQHDGENANVSINSTNWSVAAEEQNRVTEDEERLFTKDEEELLSTISVTNLDAESSSLNFSQGRGTIEGNCNSATTTLAPHLHVPSRQQRLQSKLFLTLEDKQTKITDFCTVFKKIELESRNHEEFLQTVNDNFQVHSAISSEKTQLMQFKSTSEFLNMLKESALRNSNSKKHSNRFDEPLKVFSLYLFIIGGRLLYETLYCNLTSVLPSISTVNRMIDENCGIYEGVVRMKELRQFLCRRGYPLKVYTSEDQTAVTKRIRYDSKTNNMIGFVLPLSKEHGFPKTDQYQVNSVEDIRNAFSNSPQSVNAYVFMAQPLVDKAPAFCVSIFGSDNKFNSEDVFTRWKHLQEKAAECDIEIDGFASDGDWRCLKAMRMLVHFPKNSDEHDLLKTNSPYDPFFWVST